MAVYSEKPLKRGKACEKADSVLDTRGLSGSA